MASLAEYEDHVPQSNYEDDYATDPDNHPQTISSKDLMSHPLYKLLLLVDSQAFGVVAGFPFTFIIATGASALTILILLQFTLQSLPVTVASFSAANITAFFVGRTIGEILEEWHFNQLLDNGLIPSSIGPASTLPYSSLPQTEDDKFGKSNSNSNNSSSNKGFATQTTGGKRSLGGYQSTGTDEEDAANISMRPIIRRRAFRPRGRNMYFLVAVCTAVVVANILGAMIGSLCAKTFPSRLKR